MLPLRAAWRISHAVVSQTLQQPRTRARLLQSSASRERFPTHTLWTADEERKLVHLRATGKTYGQLLSHFPRRTEKALRTHLHWIARRRVAGFDEALVKKARGLIHKRTRRVWSSEQREEMRTLRREGWTFTAIAKKVGAAHATTIVQLCRLQRESKKYTRYSAEEDALLVRLKHQGLKMSSIAKQLPYRSVGGLSRRWRHLATESSPEQPRDVEQRPASKHQRWTESDIARLKHMRRQGVTVARMSLELGRSRQQISDKSRALFRKGEV